MLNLDNIVSNKNENKDNNWPSRMLIIGKLTLFDEYRIKKISER